MSMQGRHVVIVGAGPGGLAAAMLLAGAGLDVTVLESRDRVGGRTSALEAGGFRFDTGPTFFLYPRVLEEIFAAVGMNLHDEVDLVRLDPQYRIHFGAGGRLDATPDLARMEAEVAALAPGDAGGVARFLAANRDKLERFRPILESPFEGWRDVVRPELARLLPLVAPWRSLDAELARFFSDERIRMAFSFQSKYLGMSPFRCPSLFSILSFLEYEYGVFHPRGGCAAVSEAMAEAAERLGAEIRLGEPVEEVIFRGRRAVGVRTARGHYPADAVVINADFARAMERLVPDAPAPPLERPPHRRQALLLLDVHALPRDRRALRRAATPHDLRRRGLPPQPRRHRGSPPALRRSVVLRAERLCHRPHRWRRPGRARSTCWCR